MSKRFCQPSRQITQASPWKLAGSCVLHDPERNADASCKAEAAEGRGDNLTHSIRRSS